MSACTEEQRVGVDGRQRSAALYTDQLLSESDPSACFDTIGLSSDQHCGACIGLQNVWGVVDVAGIVSSGGTSCCFNCAYPPNGNYYQGCYGGNCYADKPQLSDGDNCVTHDGRDYLVGFVPTDAVQLGAGAWVLPGNGASPDWSRTYRSDRARWLMDTSQSGQMDIEQEIIFGYPTYPNMLTGIWGGAVLQFGQSPYGGGAYVTPFPLPTPWAADQLAIRGNSVIDRGHPGKEVHPPVAIAWFHKNSLRHWTLTFNVQSHSMRPSFDPNNVGMYTLNQYGGTFSPQFTLRDYDPSRSLVIGYSGDNFMVDPGWDFVPYFNSWMSLRRCNNSCGGGTPWAMMAGGDPCRVSDGTHHAVGQYFSYSTNPAFGTIPPYGSNGIITLYLSTVAGTENTWNENPNMGSGSIYVCQPSTQTEACGSRTCGTVSDGCVGTYNCGTCASGYVCNLGQCVVACSPATCSGCCSAGLCYPGNTNSRCGVGGTACQNCGRLATCDFDGSLSGTPGTCY